jgi:hypothetical protein
MDPLSETRRTKGSVQRKTTTAESARKDRKTMRSRFPILLRPDTLPMLTTPRRTVRKIKGPAIKDMMP